MRNLALFTILLVSCSSLAEDDGLSSGHQGQLSVNLAWQQDAHSEIVQCHYFKLQNTSAVEVDRIKVDFPPGSHHVHLYRADSPEDDGVRDCTAGIDWTRWSLVVGVQTQPLDWQLPDGVTVQLAPHQQLLAQVHWINGTDDPVDRAINIEFHTTTHSSAHLGVAFGVSKDVLMNPGEQKVIGGFCPLPEGSHLAAIMGHFHGRGRRYRADLRQDGSSMPRASVYEAADEQTFEFRRYEIGEYTSLPGEGLAYECDYYNDTNNVLTWGPDTTRQEHCNLAAYYWPAPAEHPSTLYLSGELAGIDGEAIAGRSSPMGVTLTRAAGPFAVTVALEGDAFATPVTAVVPPWQTRGSFVAQGGAPARDALARMTTGAGWTEQSVRVWGLALSEVYYNPAVFGQGLQWIEVANLGNVPVDLSGYSLGAGAGYAGLRIPLGDRALAPGACLVVGGADNPRLPPDDPQSGVYVEPIAFQPELGLGLLAADGIGLFDASANVSFPPGTPPLDALVYGGPNATGLLDRMGMVARPVGGSAAGDSLERANAAGWQDQNAPSPGICRVTNVP